MITLTLEKLCVTILLFLSKVRSQKVGIHDLGICQKTRTSLSCLHQLPQSIQPSSSCEVEFIEPSKCEPYHINSPYDPLMLPFNLNLYQFRKSVWHSLSFNISFPNPSWKSMSFYIQNQLEPKTQLCRKFNLLLNSSDMLEPYSVFWDCLLFDANFVESQPFSLYLMDDNQFGGLYSFRAPMLKNFNSTTSINDWQVFFYIQSYYAETTGKLFVTIQLAPFPDVSYAISSVKCLNGNHTCEHATVLDTVILNNTHFADANNADLLVTTKVAAPFEHGVFAVTVQVISDLCNTSGCAVSLSPTYVIKGSYNWSVTAVCLIFGAVFIISLSIWVAVRLSLKIHSNFQNYMVKKRDEPDSVLIVYHAHSQEYLKFIRYFSYLLKCKLCMHPLIIDDNIGTVNPDEWTRILLSSANKVLFIVPNTLNIESTTPIQHQWLLALKYFSGTYLKRQESISSRCATIILPNSFQLAVGSEIYSLPRFNLPRDLLDLTNWLHRNYYLDKILFWPSTVKKEIGTLSSYINYAINPILNKKPDINSIVRKKIIISEDVENDDHLSQSSIDVVDDALIEKVRKEFDPLIPDIRNIDCDSDNEELSYNSDSSCSNSEDSCDVLNFVD